MISFGLGTQILPSKSLNLGSFDVAIAVDVLHHIDETEQLNTLKEIARHSKYILVMDHFE